MNKKERIENTFIEVLRQNNEKGGAGMYASDIKQAAEEIPVRAPLLYRLGDTALHLVGIKRVPYRPNYSTWRLYTTLTRLESSGKVESEWFPPNAENSQRRRLYHLTKPSTEQ